MGALLSTTRSILNLLLPFTNAQTPLLQDLIHTVILCGTLYFAPQIAEHYNSQLRQGHNDATISIPEDTQNTAPETPIEDIPVDESMVLQPDTDDGEELEPPPLAPTPPLGIAGPARPPPPRVEDFAEEPGIGEPGPANAALERPRPTPQNRIIGTKKAKSLARKDQRRAYNEFHRQEAELRRLREAEGKDEREAALAAEKTRRAEVEREIAEREREARERKKEEERREQEEERQRRERVVERVRVELERKGAVDLMDIAWAEGKDGVWIERLIRASGLLSQPSREGEHTMITSEGWAVRIDARLMREAYADAVAYGKEHNGKVSFAEFGGLLEKAVRVRAKAC